MTTPLPSSSKMRVSLDYVNLSTTLLQILHLQFKQVKYQGRFKAKNCKILISL